MGRSWLCVRLLLRVLRLGVSQGSGVEQGRRALLEGRPFVVLYIVRPMNSTFVGFVAWEMQV
jgi:hypothetical protein